MREEVLGEVPEHVRERISPELWRLAWARMREPGNQAIMVELMGRIRDSVAAFPDFQAHLREHRPPALIVWGPHDGYLPVEAGAAYLDDLPDAELHVVNDAGHWLIETHLGELVALTRDFLGRVHP
nr:alpha/beta hydrolase [Jiangella ureilytica]